MDTYQQNQLNYSYYAGITAKVMNIETNLNKRMVFMIIIFIKLQNDINEKEQKRSILLKLPVDIQLLNKLLIV